MPIEILMPALSPTMEEGNLAKWLKKEGDKVSSGDVIAEIETDKATMEVEATDDGIIGKILVPEGTNGVKVNNVIGILLEKGEDKTALEGFEPSSTSAEDSKKDGDAKKDDSLNEDNKKSNESDNSKERNALQSDERIFASPLAKRIAQQEDIDLSTIQGSGPNGRVIKKDLEGCVKGGSNEISVQNFGRNAKESYTIPHSNMRKVIAKRLLESKQTVPHFYVSVDVSINNLNKARKQINEYLSQFEEKVSVNDIIVKCCANALKMHPNVNASWSENSMTIYNNVDISIAVGVDGGLITPIVKNADIKSLRNIALETKDLIKRAKSNNLSLEEFQGGGFSVSNLGMYNVAHFSAIINPPQSAIIAIGGVKSIPKLCKTTNTLCEDNIITLTLSCDHRVIDGVLAAEFLNTVKSFIENPNLLSL